MNNVNLSGRAVKDVELRFTQSGKAIANGTIAVQRKFKNQQGEYESDFINFVCWGKGGELLAQYVNKGDFFGISGQLTTRNYEKEGRKVYVTEVNVQDFDFPVKQKESKPQNDLPFDNDPFANDAIDINSDNLPF